MRRCQSARSRNGAVSVSYIDPDVCAFVQKVCENTGEGISRWPVFSINQYDYNYNHCYSNFTFTGMLSTNNGNMRVTGSAF